MSPLMIEIMLHYNSRPRDYGEVDDNFGSSAVQETLAWFVEEGLLTKHLNSDLNSRMYKITERGLAYIEGLKAMPLPVQEWYIPNVMAKRCPGN